MADPLFRCASLIAAACLIGPAVPGGIVDRRPEEAAKALTRMADLLLPWLEEAEAVPACVGEAAIADGDPRYFRVCGNCTAAFATAQELVADYNAMVQAMNEKRPAAFPVAVAAGPAGVRFCPHCLRDF